jgi:hypothetical protein
VDLPLLPSPASTSSIGAYASNNGSARNAKRRYITHRSYLMISARSTKPDGGVKGIRQMRRSPAAQATNVPLAVRGIPVAFTNNRESLRRSVPLRLVDSYGEQARVIILGCQPAHSPASKPPGARRAFSRGGFRRVLLPEPGRPHFTPQHERHPLEVQLQTWMIVGIEISSASSPPAYAGCMHRLGNRILASRINSASAVGGQLLHGGYGSIFTITHAGAVCGAPQHPAVVPATTRKIVKQRGISQLPKGDLPAA